MPRPGASPADVFTGLRDQLFHADLASQAPADPSTAPSGTGPEVIGVAMEGATEGGTYLVFGLRDGTASLYTSTGGGWIGGQGRPDVNAAAKRLAEKGRE